MASSRLLIVVPREVDDKIQALVAGVSGEVGWWGLIKPLIEEGRLQGVLLYDVLVPQQTVGSASVDVKETPDAFSVMDELEAQGRQDEIANLRCWGHSHGNMGVFASSTDLKFWSELAQTGEGCAISAFSVHNKRGEIEAHIYVRIEGLGVLQLPADWKVVSLSDSAKEWAKEQVERRVRSHGYSLGTRYSYKWDGSQMVREDEDVWDYWPDRPSEVKDPLDRLLLQWEDE